MSDHLRDRRNSSFPCKLRSSAHGGKIGAPSRKATVPLSPRSPRLILHMSCRRQPQLQSPNQHRQDPPVRSNSVTLPHRRAFISNTTTAHLGKNIFRKPWGPESACWITTMTAGKIFCWSTLWIGRATNPASPTLPFITTITMAHSLT